MTQAPGKRDLFAGFALDTDDGETSETVRERMELALETTDGVVWEVNLDAETVIVHGPFERVFGVRKETLSTWAALVERAVHPADRERFKRTFDRIARGSSDADRIEYRTNPETGGLRWIRADWRVPPGEDGRRVIGVARDATEAVERERMLQRQRDRLEEFAGIVSHDIRNPLNVAEGKLTLAREECDSASLDGVAQAHARIRTLIDDLLALARNGERVTETELVDLGVLVPTCWRNVETADATLVTDAPPVVRGDQSRLRQLLENLFDNAITHGGPDVTVTVGSLDDGFYLEDDGDGIPPEERAQVFEWRYSTASDGTGFGLSIVETVAHAHGWDVVVTEGCDGGARFEIRGVETDIGGEPAA